MLLGVYLNEGGGVGWYSKEKRVISGNKILHFKRKEKKYFDGLYSQTLTYNCKAGSGRCNRAAFPYCLIYIVKWISSSNSCGGVSGGCWIKRPCAFPLQERLVWSKRLWWAKGALKVNASFFSTLLFSCMLQHHILVILFYCRSLLGGAQAPPWLWHPTELSYCLDSDWLVTSMSHRQNKLRAAELYETRRCRKCDAF